MNSFLRSSALLTLGISLAASAQAARSYRVTVAAENADRAGQVVSLTLPSDAPPQPVLRDAAGRTLPMQIEAGNQARFIIEHQRGREALVFTLEAGQAAPPSGVEARAQDGRLEIAIGGQPAFFYQMEPAPLPQADIDPKYLRGGFLHPVLTPSGRLVTESYPPDHRHHHGIWAPWTKTSFQGRTPDFWNMGQGTGTVEFVGLDRSWSGPVHAGFESRHRFVDLSAPTPVVVLHETWRVTAYALPEAAAVRVFDLEIRQTCATDDPLILPEYHYGGLGIRGHADWLGADKCFFLTSEGETDRVKAHATRARWCHLGGFVQGQFAGLAVLSHPDNVRAPQPLRVHPKEPFVCFAPSQLGEWRIEPGQPYEARYRFVVADGQPDRAQLDRYWQGFARPAVVTLTPR